MTFGARRFAQLLFVIAAAIFFLLGVTHIALTIRDLYDPTSLTPTDYTVRQAMIDARLRRTLAFLASTVMIGVSK